ncbi:hypothetical protein HanRHA438_Chr16g0753881 [Helianthus annuus]|uniref:Uncharacterized protein n=1 Tax=Helianthus annuus TaxID=4232 RepID=A0A251U103_HELAN|nr:hypothetical protein HanXRQr2_Chr16g0741751 [Helianthus annuus]KAJ0437680.1 hypothetical protein HanHA300_Chr16g0605001 [Helianthus annuus]KAJ0442209.1 hypothetical protein HanIR_Chr16g0806581 [Helianthus annuus]KAJ0459999.1 hypothetical protein HanHA89_Chr16g0655531 [Helianthus annuus]KAJ0644399.1 hypothetical protein HanOQP8_Chr16g0611671 [Helianthus annuus]
MVALLSSFFCLQPTSMSSTHVLLVVIDKIIQFPLNSSLPCNNPTHLFSLRSHIAK